MITPFPGEKEDWSLVATYSNALELDYLCTKGKLIKNITERRHDISRDDTDITGYLYYHKGILKSYIGTTGPIIHRRQRDHAKKRAKELLKGGDVQFWVAPLYCEKYERMAIENYYIFTYNHEYNLINESFKRPSYDIRIERSPILTAPSIFDAISI